MKWLLILLMAATVIAAPLKVDTLGEYKNVEFTQREGDFVKFFHSYGINKILISELPDELRAKVLALPEKVQPKEEAKPALITREKFIRNGYAKVRGRVTHVFAHGILIDPADIEMIGDKSQVRTFVLLKTNRFRAGEYVELETFFCGSAPLTYQGEKMRPPTFAEDFEKAFTLFTNHLQKEANR